MGRIDEYSDPTGKMSLLDQNAQNIQNLIDEINRNSDQLDSLGNSLNIIGKGSVSGTWNGVGGINSGLNLTATHGLSFAPIFIAFYSRSDKPNQYFAVPDWEFDNAGSLLGRSYGLSLVNTFLFNFARTSNGAPINVTFSWFAIQQPANVPTGA